MEALFQCHLAMSPEPVAHKRDNLLETFCRLKPRGAPYAIHPLCEMILFKGNSSPFAASHPVSSHRVSISLLSTHLPNPCTTIESYASNRTYPLCSQNFNNAAVANFNLLLFQTRLHKGPPPVADYRLHCLASTSSTSHKFDAGTASHLGLDWNGLPLGPSLFRL